MFGEDPDFGKIIYIRFSFNFGENHIFGTDKFTIWPPYKSRRVGFVAVLPVGYCAKDPGSPQDSGQFLWVLMRKDTSTIVTPPDTNSKFATEILC